MTKPSPERMKKDLERLSKRLRKENDVLQNLIHKLEEEKALLSPRLKKPKS